MEEMTTLFPATMPEATDLSPEGETASDGAMASGMTASEGAGGNQTGGQSAEPITPAVISVKYNKQNRELSLEEAKTYAQKGMKYDSLAPVLNRLAYLGARSGQTLEQLAESLYQAEEAALQEELRAQAGGDESLFGRLLELEHGKHQKAYDAIQAELRRAEEAQAEASDDRLAREFLELRQACPEIQDVSALPDEVLADAVGSGRHLLDSFLRYRQAESRRAEETRVQRQSAAARSLGPLGSKPENPVSMAQDAMLRGVWS